MNHLEVTSFTADGINRRITRINDKEIYHEFDRIVPFDNQLDGHVLAVLLYAMRAGDSLSVHGNLSRNFMRNIEELQRIWSRWKPDTYKIIDIIPEKIVDTSNMNNKAIAAFSGGVDATFTALSHTKPGNGRYPLSTLLMVHGFDVAVDNTGDFQKLVSRVKPFIEETGLDFRIIKTNSKSLKQNWEDSCGLELAACLHMYSHEFRYGLIGSSDPYEALVLPWGSSPVTDHLMSGDSFSIIHDGAGFSRTEKVVEISRNSVACQTLKVCWEGSDQSKNCGKCEKCTRTRLNFLAAGKVDPPCFVGEFDYKSINSITISNAPQLAELAGIVKYARAHNVSGNWLPILEKRINSWKPGSGYNKGWRTIKALIVKVLVAFGIEQQARKWQRSFRKAIG